MKFFCGVILIGCTIFGLRAQSEPLPRDFRQHNITEYNSSILNPAYALDRNNAPSAALWTRWQWQVYDADPTTLFFNYTAKLSEDAALGGSFFQNNTDIFINSGMVVNYAYTMRFSEKVRLGVGLNLFAFQQKLSDERLFTPNPIQTTLTNDFVLQLAPGFNLKVDQFSFGIVSENLFEYNLSSGERNSGTAQRTFLGLASYDFTLGSANDAEASYVRPSVYFKSIPGFATQVGLNTIYSTPKYWAQLGYNSFYGISTGFGGRFFKRFSVGALVEFGTSPGLKGQDPSFELVTAYKFKATTKEAEEEKKEELLAAQETDTKEQKPTMIGAPTEQELAAQKELELEKAKATNALEQELADTKELVQEKTASSAEQELAMQKELEQEKERIATSTQQELAMQKELEQEKERIAAPTQQELAMQKELEQEKERIVAPTQQELAMQKELEQEKERIAATAEQELSEQKEIAQEKAIAPILEQEKQVAAKPKKQSKKELRRINDSIASAQQAAALAELNALRQKKIQDSIAVVQLAQEAAVAAALQQTQDSLATIAEEKAKAAALALKNEVVKPEAGERYEEVSEQGSLTPGYYLIANVFGTKRYFDIFMTDMKKKGLSPGSFYRQENKYNYVYLGQYSSIDEAREARNSKLGGKYQEKLWIFRVTGK